MFLLNELFFKLFILLFGIEIDYIFEMNLIKMDDQTRFILVYHNTDILP